MKAIGVAGAPALGPAAPLAVPSSRPAGVTPATRPARVTVAWLPRDARRYQILVLAGLLLYGMVWLGLDIGPAQVAITLAASLGTQAALSRLFGLPRVDPWSALISGLSLCLLLRTGSLGLAAAAAALAIASKFALRIRGKHVFNPTNLAIVLLLLVTDRVWVSSGQWGSTATFAFLLAAAGGLVVNRAARVDVTAAFLATHAALLFGRSTWLGEPWTIPLHRLESGALVLFAFFMISDPRTTPDSRTGRLLFALAVAAGAHAVQFKLFRPNGLLWSLAVCSLLVPLVDRMIPGAPFEWRPASPSRRNVP